MSYAPARQSLSKSLSLALGLLCSAIVLVVLALVFVFLTWRVGEQMQDEAENTIAFLCQALETPFWTLDRDGAVAVAQAIARNQNIGLLELRDARGEKWFGHETGNELFTTSKAEVRHEGQVIGFISLGLEDSSRTRAVAGIGAVGGGIALLVILAQYFMTSRILRNSLKEPFEALDALVGAFARGEYNPPAPRSLYAEFEPLTRAFLDMGRTVQRQMEDLRQNEEKYRAIFDNSPVGIFRTTFEGALLEGNPALGRMFGYADRDDFESVNGFRVERVYADPAVRRDLQRALSGQVELVTIEAEFVRKDSSRFEAVLTASVQRDADGRPTFLNGVVEDVSLRKEAERSLAESEAKFRALFDAMPNGFYRSTPAGYFVDANPAFVRMLGYDSLEELKTVHIPTEMYVHETKRSEILADNPEFISQNEHYRLKRKDGQIIWVEDNARYIQDEDGVIIFHEGICRDVTDRKLAEERRRQSEEKFSRLFRLSPDVILLLNMEQGRIIDVNEAFSTVTGFAWEEAVGKTAHGLGLYACPKVREEIRDLLRRHGKVENFEFTLHRKDGTVIDCVLSCQMLNVEGEACVMSVVRDVTEFKRMQQMMIQTEKMVSVGGIAAGVAHEINNPLGIIMVTSQNLVQRTRPDFPRNLEVARSIGLDMALMDRYMHARGLHDFVRNIQEAALRAADIIRHMLDFSRRSESKRRVCDMRAIMERAIALAGSDYDLKKNYDFKKIRIVWECDDALPRINCTETEIKQVFLNLLRNSAQAMASAREEIADPRIAIRMRGAGDRVILEVEDNGPGMPTEVQRRAFEPFYTTKPPGVGTGLGLSVSYFIITRGHDGLMRLESRPGEGAKFTIELPVVQRGTDTEDACSQES
jgi:PAS domain S-box-containing protein